MALPQGWDMSGPQTIKWLSLGIWSFDYDDDEHGNVTSQEASLTHWGRVTHICVSKLTIIGSDNGLSPGRRQAIIWNNDGILLIRTFRTHFSEIVSEIHTFSLEKTHVRMSSGKWRPSCLDLNVRLWPEYSGRIRLISWLQMHWFLVSPGRQAMICGKNRAMSSTRKKFNYLRHHDAEKWMWRQINFYVSSKQFTT